MKPRHAPMMVASGMCLVLGCGASGATSPKDPFKDVRGFRGYTLYALGAKYRTLAVTDVSRTRDGRRKQPTFRFIYGDCKPAADSGCAPPYEVQNYAACSRNPAVYPHYARARRTERLRGTRVDYFFDDLAFERAEVYTGRTTVVVFAASAPKARRAVHTLSSIDGRVGVGETLPKPADGVIRGRVSC